MAGGNPVTSAGEGFQGKRDHTLQRTTKIMIKTNVEKLPQGGTGCAAAGESATFPSGTSSPHSYSGGGNKCLPSRGGSSSDARSESDAASGAEGSFKSPERVVVGAVGKNKRFFLKRPKPRDGQGSHSDGGMASARKIGRRCGPKKRGGELTTQEGREASPAEPAQRAVSLATEGRHTEVDGRRVALSESSGGGRDAAGGSKTEQAARFAEVVVAAIKGVALKRTQSSKDKAISAATASIIEAAEAIHFGPSPDGMSEMRAEVARLTAAMERLRKENVELRADLAKVQGAGHREAVTGRAQHGQGQPVSAEDRVLTLVRHELAAFQSRFSTLEAIVLRPPLAASHSASGQRKAASYAATAAKPGSSGRTHSGAVAGPPLAKPASPQTRKGGVTAQTAKAPAVTERRPPPPSKSPPADAEWQIVGEKGKVGKAARAARRRQRRQRRKERNVAARLRAPKSAAVVITLQPEAEKKGMTYREVLGKARTAVNLQEIGVTNGLRLRVTATGARMLEVPGAASGPTADALAEKLRASLNADEVRVSRPTKCADMRILGLDDSVTEEEVVAAVVRTGGCSAQQVRAGTIRPDFTGMQSITVSCPVTAAQKIAGEGRRLLVGWVSAQVKLLEPRPLRCFRCQVGNHVGVQCTSEVDRSGHCFRCGQPGHKAGSCSAAPHCFICAAAGKPADHRVGSKACVPPAKARGRGKPTATAVNAASADTAAAAAASTVVAAATIVAGPSQRAREGADMECQ